MRARSATCSAVKRIYFLRRDKIQTLADVGQLMIAQVALATTCRSGRDHYHPPASGHSKATAEEPINRLRFTSLIN